MKMTLGVRDIATMFLIVAGLRDDEDTVTRLAGLLDATFDSGAAAARVPQLDAVRLAERDSCAEVCYRAAALQERDHCHHASRALKDCGDKIKAGGGA